MCTRELDRNEWSAFFDAFTRQFRGRRMTLEIPGAARDPAAGAETATAEVIVRDAPLVGITAEHRPGDGVDGIEIVFDLGPDGELAHTVAFPSHVCVGQVSNGNDEVLVIRSHTAPTVRLDFRQAAPTIDAAAGAVEHY